MMNLCIPRWPAFVVGVFVTLLWLWWPRKKKRDHWDVSEDARRRSMEGRG